jgi:hypothetical protein
MVVYGNISYYDPSQLRRVMREALATGATATELAKVIELTGVMGYHELSVMKRSCLVWTVMESSPGRVSGVTRWRSAAG